MRVFISIEVSDDLKDKIVEIQKKFSFPGVKLVERENLHFCLMFLGDVEDDKIDSIKEAMDKVAKMFERFEINISGLGAFPNKNYINVLFLEVREGKQAMIGIAKALRENLPDFKSGKPFVPHLTLARVKSGNDKLKELAVSLEKIEVGKMVVSEIKLIKSNLTPQGPTYEEIFTAIMGK